MDRYGSALVYCDREGAGGNLSVVAAVISDACAGHVKVFLVITLRTEGDVKILSGICVLTLEGNGNGNALATEAEYYVVAACCCIVNSGSVYGSLYGDYGIVGVVSLNYCVSEVKLIAYGIVLLKTINLNLVESGSCGSFLVRIDDDRIDVRGRSRLNYNLRSLCEVYAEGIVSIVSDTVDGVIAATGIRDNGYKSACLNVEDNLCALVELGVTTSGGKLTLGCIDKKAIPL